MRAMSIEPIGALTVLAGLICLWLGTGALVHGLAITAVLGAAAALFIGGANVLPGHLMVAFLAFGVLSRRRESVAVIKALHPNEPGFWFACLVAYGVASAILMPRVLAGVTPIIPLGTSVFEDTGSTVPLTPVSSNLTQSVHLCATLLCLLTLTAVASTRQGFTVVLSAILAYCVANLAFALIDVATYLTGTQELLSFIRNARYTLHTDSEVAGMKRIVGSYTETSVFARSTLGVFGFTGTLWLYGVQRALTGSLAAFSFVLIVLSTSSTGLVGAPIMLLLLYATALVSFVQGRAGGHAGLFAFYAPVIGLAVVLLLLLNPEATAEVRSYVDLVVLNKAESDSGVERSSWNVVSFQNFLDSWGLGVGLGTTRASSFAVALLASVGIPGALFFAIFALECFLRPRGSIGSLEADAAVAARNGYAGLLLGDLLVSPVIDQGLLFCMFAALSIAARPRRGEVRAVPPIPAGARL